MSKGSRERSHAKYETRSVVQALVARDPDIDRFTLIVSAGLIMDRRRPQDDERARYASYTVIYEAALRQRRSLPDS